MIESAILFIFRLIGLVSVALVLVYTVIHVVKDIMRVCGIGVRRDTLPTKHRGPGQRSMPHEHQWGEWTYAAPGDCHRIRICRQCGARSAPSIVQHVCDEWAYAAPGDCHRTTTCRRCGVRIAGDVQHAWGEEYTAPGACQTTRTCTRCGEREIIADAHLWGEWKYDPPTSCQQVCICLQCGKQDRRDMACTHQWSATIADPAAPWRQTRTCTRCGGQTVYLAACRRGNRDRLSIDQYES